MSVVGGFVTIAVGLGLMAEPPAAGVAPYRWLSVAAGITGVGMGLSVPASNNATLALAPDQVAAIAGLRGMFRQSGAIIGVSVSTAILARSAHPGPATVGILLALAALLLAVLPLVRLVPEHRGNW